MGEKKGGGGGGNIFRCADGVDKLLMMLGVLSSIGDGMVVPLILITLNGIIKNYGSPNVSFSNEIVNKFSLRMLYVAIFVGISGFIEGMCWTRTAERQTSRIRTEYLKSILRQEVGFFDNQDASSSTTFQIVSSISADAHTIQDVIADKIPNTIARLSEFLGGNVLAFYLSWRMALASIPFVVAFVVPTVALGKLFMGLQARSKDTYGTAGSIAEQAISSIRTVYSYVGENQTLDRFRQALQEYMNFGIKLGIMKGLMIGSIGTMFASWAFLAWVGSVLVINENESGPRVFISICSVTLAGLSTMSLLPNLPIISEGSSAAKRMFEMIDRVPEIDTQSRKGKVLDEVKGDIEFRDVHFRYPSRPNTPILQGLNLRIKAGKTVGLVGGSGSGKSTIIALLERFYDPNEGDIRLDGHKIKKLQLNWLRSRMGLVNQEPILFATSIKENILFGKEGASMEMVINAAQAANAHDFIMKLPARYETHVGQFGVQLSGGQKQRIAIARALLKDPKILLLDEATSALDAESERLVQEALDEASLGRTTVVVAHRLSTIRKADKIVVLQSGRVVESGSHNELMKKRDGGVYFQMVQMQQSETSNQITNPAITPYHEKGTRSKRRSPIPQTPKSPYSARSGGQNSPFSPFSPALSMSNLTPELCSYYDSGSDESDDDYSDFGGQSNASQWRLFKMNAPEWKRALLGCLGAGGFGACHPIHAYLLGSLVSVYFLENSSKIKSETRFCSIIFAILAVVTLISNFIQHYNFAVMGERVTKKVREEMLRAMLTFEIGWYDRDENTSAAICARLATEANLIKSLVGDRMALFVQVFVSATLAFALALVLTWKVSIVMIAMQPLIVASFYSRSVVMKNISASGQKAQNEGSQLASEAVINHKTITAFSSQEKILNLFKATLEGPRNMAIKQSWISAIALFCSQFVNVATMSLTFWYGGRLMNRGEVNSKHLFQAFFILMSTGRSIADAGSVTNDISKGSSAIKSIFAILDRKTEIDPEDFDGIKVERGSLSGQIELKHVAFSYPSRPEQIIFQDLSLKIEPGKKVALVGQSGSGKSTIIGLIERFYDPIKGSIVIDDHDIRSYNLRSLRSHIGLVSQEPTLFGGSIRENIVYGKEDATEAEIKKAAILANADEFISSMKDGYSTYCGERGVQLSGGQKQRIALARAILKNPTILLLDEATSALDSVSENLVQEALEKMMVGRTCVIVAHRLSTIQKSDTIAVIRNGMVVEKGSHSDLVGRQGAYYSLIKLQHGQTPYRQ
ncbi:OLC1v1028468C1 [Oldenlandia corymbosa var. corymbosa]|uniref:OLC1v1028468C1 n=1 Tax=Oldenlandia corymbosa var. corymbosa TaxID=529605 RepID=A0AAV1CET9_OLDCO|nr:OLC1v1028468C1 [Oldenlandia corymbosa var. corymbosa]